MPVMPPASTIPKAVAEAIAKVPGTYPTAFLDNLQAYNLNAGVDSMLDLARMVIDADSYYYNGVAFPTGATLGNMLVGPGATYAANVAIEPYSYLVNISGLSVFAEGPAAFTPGMFKLRIYEKGSKSDIFNGQFALSSNVASGMEYGAFFPAPTPQDVPFGVFWLQSPLVILPPGSLQIEITNLEAVACYIQILMAMATPVTDRSLNIVDVKG